MIQILAPEILEKYVKPVFLKYSSVNINKRSEKSKKQTVGLDGGNESWRGEIAQSSNLLYFCILHLKVSK